MSESNSLPPHLAIHSSPSCSYRICDEDIGSLAHEQLSNLQSDPDKLPDEEDSTDSIQIQTNKETNGTQKDIGAEKAMEDDRRKRVREERETAREKEGK